MNASSSSDFRPLQRLLISLYHKDVLDELAPILRRSGVTVFSTGGTLAALRRRGVAAHAVEELTGYPSILGGRVKTLHPQVMGGVLMEPGLPDHREDAARYQLQPFDAVMVDLYPFRQALEAGKDDDALRELIDIGGIALIRAAAKNYGRVLVIPSVEYADRLAAALQRSPRGTTLPERREMAAVAFSVSAAYDRTIAQWMSEGKIWGWEGSRLARLRYGENPHQEAAFYASQWPFRQLNGKPLSYNNLLDLHHALALLMEWPDQPAFAVIKHTNACGVGVGDSLQEAADKALRGDPLSAFGGILVTNRPVDPELAERLSGMFYEVLWAPDYHPEALPLLTRKKKRIVLRGPWPVESPAEEFRTALGGVLRQRPDAAEDNVEEWRVVTPQKPDDEIMADLKFAWKVVKHLKSNAIAITKGQMLIGAGHGQTSRVDAVRHAIARAADRGHQVRGAVAASDAFFPFADSVEQMGAAGIRAIIQPGGSIRDEEVIAAAAQRGLIMVMTGRRHFKH